MARSISVVFKQLATRISVVLFILVQLQSMATPEEWLQKIEVSSDPVEKTDYYIDLCKEVLTSNPDRAIEEGFKGIEIATEAGYSEGEANLLNIVGAAYWYKQDLQAAIEYYNRSLALRIPGKDDAEIASNHNNIGIAHMVLGKFREAVTHLKKAFTIRSQLGLKIEAASASANLGYAHSYLGEFEQAIEYLTESLDIAEDLNDLDLMTSCYISIGNVHQEIEDQAKAADYFQRALTIARKTNDADGLAACLGSLGNIDLMNKRYEDALDKYNELIALDQTSQTLHYLSGAYNGMGNAHLELGHLHQAKEFLLKAIEANDQLGNQSANTRIYTTLSDLYTRIAATEPHENDSLYDQAIVYAQKALELAHESESDPERQKAYEYLYQAFLAQEDYENALSAHVNFKSISDKLLDSTKLKQIAELESQYQLSTKTREIEKLQSERTIQELQIREQEERMKAKNRLIYGILSFLIMLAIAAVLFWKWYQYRQLNLQNELTIKNLQTEQKLFRSQINPHFVFNSLNSIQAYISSNDAYLAEKYLAKFAKLMRGILENSLFDTVPFEKEKTVIESYLELERVRFQNRFNYRIIVDDDFEEEFISIPPMIIQPFLENAILHGFKGIENEGGQLDVRFSETNDIVTCQIDDNGIGREAAAKLPKKKNKTSLATQITEQRLATISNQTGKLATMEIVDKYDDVSGNPTGTRIILKIPVA